MCLLHSLLYLTESLMPGGTVTPLYEINTTKSHKNVLPPIVHKTPVSIIPKTTKSKKEKKIENVCPKEKDSDLDSITSGYFSVIDSKFKLPSLPIEMSQYGTKSDSRSVELNFIQLKKHDRMTFPKTTRKLLLPDEAERPCINGTNSSVAKIASPYIQIIREEGVLSMVLVDPLSSVPKIGVIIFTLANN